MGDDVSCPYTLQIDRLKDFAGTEKQRPIVRLCFSWTYKGLKVSFIQRIIVETVVYRLVLSAFITSGK